MLAMITEQEKAWASFLISKEFLRIPEGVMPTNEIKGGIFLLISGLLLITPGFFTDCVGFAVFLKPVQDIITLKAKNYFVSRTRRY